MKLFHILFFVCGLNSAIQAENLDTLGIILEIDTTINICPGENYLGYSTSGVYIDTTVSNGICTISRLDLIVFPITPDEYILNCIEPDDMSMPIGRDTIIKQDINGCDFAEVTENFRRPPDVTTNVSICEGEIIIMENEIIDESGTYVIELFDMGPCPYTATLNVNVIPATSDIIHEVEICDGDCYDWQSQTLCQSGTYVNTLTGDDGCPYDEILTLIISPNQECRILEVIVFEDLNNDCLYSSEPGLNNVKVKVGDFIIKTTNSSGSAIARPRADTYRVEALLDKNIYEFCEDFIDIDLTDTVDQVVFIPVSPLLKCAAVELGGSIPLLRRCFENKFTIVTTNNGTETAEDLTLTVKMDPYFEYLSSDMNLASVVDSFYTFNLPDLSARQNFRGNIYFELLCEAELGQAHYLSSRIDYLNSCDHLDTLANIFECRTNIGSFDPNDKGIYIDGFADQPIIGEDSEIEYLIRFQNTGTDTAFTVRVEDRISEDYKLASISPVSSSHDYEWSIENDRNMVITFNDIQLVDSTKNEKDSHGFIKFTVDLEDERPAPGAIVENNAAIFFDFNDPIITNTVSTYYLCQDSSTGLEVTICEGEEYEGYTTEGQYEDTFVSSKGCDSIRILQLIVLDPSSEDCLSGTGDISQDQLNVYPIPATESLYIKYEGKRSPSIYSIYDTAGKMSISGKITDEKLDISSLESGIYMLKIIMKDGKSIDKRILVTK